MELFNNHKKLFVLASLLFVVLTIVIAILPAIDNQLNNHPLPGVKAFTEEEIRGRNLFIANGCVACHTQQVRNVEMDRPWGSRPSMAADYATQTRVDIWRNTATLMGTERTGPDLIDVGSRQPSTDWHLVHLFNPRIVVKESIMPAYSWMFELKENPATEDVVVNVPADYLKGRQGKVVATQDALDLVAYLKALKQHPLPETTVAPTFLYKMEKARKALDAVGAAPTVDGEALYVANCQACHQSNGEGLLGAFPPLKGSRIVEGDDLQLYVDIIMNGYDSRPEYGPMAPIGSVLGWTEKEVTAIINYEKSSWGNKAVPVTEEEVKKVMDYIESIK
ncbi:cbb3-type cytochrome c oxidase subunit II [Sphingobacterium sp. UT-1RO-CII-1]|uniref:cbb3-type cytochrome c oxidase subunit II n=1 Tax=Sphingobacterium sp. UT-1RO-CII-1 TaxID=2995225 RepID=UPI00227B2F25|nr:cbb3-type cytochrome c oxidase subunit II [Sphingobacterium sp. UT-1RO-CII-1]MCY4780283.1 cbb3-type cytochrome c oxidase subunit II [Sphingobacterium sp. UT-1RO-CII-1]